MLDLISLDVSNIFFIEWNSGKMMVWVSFKVFEIFVHDNTDANVIRPYFGHFSQVKNSRLRSWKQIDSDESNMTLDYNSRCFPSDR